MTSWQHQNRLDRVLEGQRWVPLNVLTLGLHQKGAAKKKSRDERGPVWSPPQGGSCLVRITHKASSWGELTFPAAAGMLSTGCKNFEIKDNILFVLLFIFKPAWGNLFTEAVFYLHSKLQDTSGTSHQPTQTCQQLPLTKPGETEQHLP